MQPRYSIRGLAILIVVVAFGLTALKATIVAPEAALIVVFLLGVGSLFVSAALALAFSGRVRRSSFGYAIFGLTYISLLISPLGRNFPTTVLIHEGAVRLSLANPETYFNQANAGLPIIRPRPALKLTAHLMVAILLGGLGAILFGFLHRSRRGSVPIADPAEGKLLAPGSWRQRVSGLWD
jgi:hypothetical protein